MKRLRKLLGGSIRPATLRLLNDHAPSGDFTPFVDESFGRVVFTSGTARRDQQAVPTTRSTGSRGATTALFNWSGENRIPVPLERVSKCIRSRRPITI
ncbi:MAG: hypothetical protein H6647_04505 [Anaerolineales bacterium]|nr:hypothetical protein [Anaerolineales bacterium]